MRKRSRETAFIASIIYFTQGALGISAISLPLYLREHGWSIAQISTASSVAALPWIFKIFYGFLSDSFPLFGYRRKSHLVFYLIAAAAGWFGLVLLPPQRYAVIFSLMLANLGFAATDVVTDAIVVEHSTRRSSAVYQSIAWGFRSFGSIVSGIVAGWLAAYWPAQLVFIMTMFLPMTVIMFVILIKEKKYTTAVFSRSTMPFERSFHLLKTHNLRWFSAILLAAALPSSFAMPFFFHLRETLKFQETLMGFLISLLWGGTAIGSIIYARWLRWVPPKTTLFWAILINSVGILGTLFIMGKWSAFVIAFMGGVLGCLTMLPIMSSAAILTHDSGVEGTLFAVLMSIYNVGQILFGYVGGWLYTLTGIYPLIVMTSVLSLSGLFFVTKLEMTPFTVKTSRTKSL